MATDSIKLSDAQTLRVVASSPEALELESSWTTGGRRPPTHWHPRQHELFEVLAGRLTVELDGKPPQILRPGETVDVPPRTSHRMWNAGPEPARALWRVSPALRTEEMFRFIDRGMSPIRGVQLLWTFRHEFRLGTPKRR
jgi:quercetin dioxygenase-like cupin family protein